MNKQEILLKNDYDCIKALYLIHKNDGWINEKVNENFIADRFVYLDTKRGMFFNNHFSYGAIEKCFNSKKGYAVKGIEYDHSEKTKSLTRKIWKLFEDNPTFEDFKNFLINTVRIVLITKEENKDAESRNIDDPIKRYKHLGIDYVYKKTTKKISWCKIHSIDDLLSNYTKIKVEDFFRGDE